jgi:hypothetical protein
MSFRPTVIAAALAAPVLAAAQAEPQRSMHHQYRVVTVAEGLVNPWSIAFLPEWRHARHGAAGPPPHRARRTPAPRRP